MSADPASTPMMRQYLAMRRELSSDVLLFFRLGDFYEMFFEDAKIAAGILNVSLTKRNGIPMCGVPHHAAQSYIARLVKAGKRVAIAEQIGEPTPGKIVQRQIAEIITAGTVTDGRYLEAEKGHYLAAIFQKGKHWGLAYVEHTTGEFELAEFESISGLIDELTRLQPREILHSEEDPELPSLVEQSPVAQSCDSYYFLEDQAHHCLLQLFQVQSLDGYGCSHMSAAVCAAGAIVQYLQFQLRKDLTHLKRLRVASPSEQVWIDAASQSHLELIQSKGGASSTLLNALNRTQTPMGARLLRRWILHPLYRLDAIHARQESVATFVDSPSFLSQIRDLLKEIRDLERISSRLSQGSGNGRDLLALAEALAIVPVIKTLLAELSVQRKEQTKELLESPQQEQNSLLDQLNAQLADLSHKAHQITEALVEEPPATLKEGGIFKSNYHELLQDFRQASTQGRDWIAQLQNQEIERTGIKSLKIKYNAVFGYFIEITKSNLDAVPSDYVRKQTTANGERFITDELKKMEDKILGADEKAKAFEYEEFVKLRNETMTSLSEIQSTAEAMAQLDILAGFAEVARHFSYVRPMVNDSKNLILVDARHPVLDQNHGGEKFVPNDTHLDAEEQRMMIITGPNMAGKSTYIRQVALLTLMAQIGCFLPVSQAEIGLVDRIFTRIGASDDLSRGQSTFMVEMNETSLILNNATDRSLVILDEIGRGTSTFDGLSIAWSVAEHLHLVIGARSLFATHYHELTSLSDTCPGIKNFNVAVKEWNHQIIFLRKILPGAAEKSYGIQVARLAGLPDAVIQRAKTILAELEGSKETQHPLQLSETPPIPSKEPRKKSPPVKSISSNEQMSLFS